MILTFSKPSQHEPKISIEEILFKVWIVIKVTYRIKKSILLLQHYYIKRTPVDILDRYPHQFSGGQNKEYVLQEHRLQPKIIICDEPTALLMSQYDHIQC